MQLFLVFILQIICSESHQKEINYVLYNIMFHSPASPYLCARVHLCSAHTEDAVFAASVLQLHTANVAWVHKSTVLLLNSMTQIVLFFFFTCIHRWILYTVYIYTMNIQLQMHSQMFEEWLHTRKTTSELLGGLSVVPFCASNTTELEFWSAVCLPTNSKEPLYSPSSVDESGQFHPVRQFGKKKKERKSCAGMVHT